MLFALSIVLTIVGFPLSWGIGLFLKSDMREALEGAVFACGLWFVLVIGFWIYAAYSGVFV